MSIKMYKTVQKLSRRAISSLLALAVIVGLLPAVIPQANAASWSQPYVDQLMEWGVMRDDIPGNHDPDAYITRAETFSLINRAFGYNKMGYIPFTDVSRSDWFYDDIVIAYNTGYLTGTSPTTATPNGSLTREEAAYILGSNLMLKETTGESLTFSDSRTFNDWSRGMIEAAAQAGVISGYPDGSFRPQTRITRGEMACMLINAVGHLIQDQGSVSLGNVFSNVTINNAGVTLKDTTIAGNLYLTGGIGLGEVMLDNVNVLGKIVTSGAGEGNQGDSSIILRNVRADEMVVDTISNQFVTIQAQGNTNIGLTSVRTPSYLQDMTGEGYGLKQINLDGEPGTSVQLVGNIKEVTNLTPASTIVVAQGTAEKVNIDESATNAQLQILNGGRVKELRLDVATNVGGAGDVDNLTVYAPGSTVTTTLPNTITVRPGITANVSGEVMDTVAAAESSSDPRLLAGFPAARNVAPTTADAVFSANKRGTIYWALTTTADGSVSDQDLVTPPAYSSRIIASGQISSTGANVEYTAKLTKLVSDGSYYISAVMVDNRGQHSPVKVAAFTTPDDTTPAFNSGYPQATLVTSDSVQVGIMPNKSCQLYYAILPKGSTAPTVQNLRTGSVSGNLGYGVRDVTKNVIDVFTVNSQSLRELTDYTVFLCLVDADSGKNSGVKTLNVKTVDGTPPVFLVEPYETRIQATSVTLSATINEAGTIYWVAVKEGEAYPKPLAGTTGTPLLSSSTAKLQVANGMNGLKAGSVRATANKAATLTISGLTAQSAYDVYYVAMDTAGNYSETVKKITIHTLDNEPPKVTLEFSKTSDAAGTMPMPDTDLRLVFSESIQADPTGYTGSDTQEFRIAYENMKAAEAARDDEPGDKDLEENWKSTVDKFATLLRDHITLMDGDAYNEPAVFERTEARDKAHPDHEYWDAIDWVDYRKATVTTDEGRTIVTFKNGEAVRLSSGGSYFFRLTSVTDTSSNHNLLRPNPYDLPKFTTVFAQVRLRDDALSALPDEFGATAGTDGKIPKANIDMSFQMHPTSTGSVTDAIYYDVILWSTLSIEYDVYGRVLKDADADNPNSTVITTPTHPALSLIGESKHKNSMDGDGWIYLGHNILTTTGGNRNGRSLNELIRGRENFCQLNGLLEGYTYEIAISLTKVGTDSNRDSWSQRVRVWVDVGAGQQSALRTLVGDIQGNWNDPEKADVTAIGTPEDFYVQRQFTDVAVPTFRVGSPRITTTDGTAKILVQLDRPGTVYYAYAKVTKNGGIWSPTLPAMVSYKDKNILVLPEEAKGPVTENGVTTPGNVTANTLNNYPTDDSDFYVAPGGDGSVSGYKLGGGIEDWTTEYKLMAPAYLDIFDPDEVANPNVVYGKKAVGTSEMDIDLKNLEPETVYYVYMILKGVSQTQSPVYVFQFTTKEARTPSIMLQRSGRIGTGRTAVQRVTATLDAAADTLDYALVAAGQEPELLSQMFKGALLNDSSAKIPEGNGSDGVKGFSVLDAMLTNYNGHVTYFDQFASGTLKSDVADYIRAAGTTGSTSQTGSLSNITAGTAGHRNLDFKETDLGDVTSYFCIAVAEHSLGGIAFAAREGIQKTDEIAPELTSVSVQITKWTNRTNESDVRYNASSIEEYEKNYGKYLVSGTITLEFSKAVYFKYERGRTVPLYIGNKSEDEDPADLSYVWFHNHIATSSGATFETTTSSEGGASTISIEFSGVAAGGFLTLFSDGYISNMSSYSTDTRLRFQFTPLNTNQTTTPDALVRLWDPGFTVTWGNNTWIATSNGIVKTK